MRRMFIGLISSLILFSCNNRHMTTNQTQMPSNADKTASVQVEKVEKEKTQEECLNEEVVVSDEDASRYENLINMGGYNYSYTQPRTNFQGAAGPGTGSSYASSYYGSQDKKDKKKVCTPSGNINVNPGTEHKQPNLYTPSKNDEKTDDILQEETDMEWNNTNTADPDPGSVDSQNVDEDGWPIDPVESEEQNSEQQDWTNSNPSAEDQDQTGQPEKSGENNEYDEVPW